MIEREKVLHGLDSCGFHGGMPNICGLTECPYREHEAGCVHELAHDAGLLISEILKAQEPRLVTEDDFKNADELGWLPVWCEERYGGLYCECILIPALEEKDIRYWTAKPSDEQRRAAKWG